MHPVRQVRGQHAMHLPLPLDARSACKSGAGQADMKMGLSLRTPSRMPAMPVGLILHPKIKRRKSHRQPVLQSLSDRAERTHIRHIRELPVTSLASSQAIPDIAQMQKTRRFHGRIESDAPPPCARDDCGLAGEFRAPRGRDRQGWQFFCLDHIREFNQHWDFCEGMSQAEIDDLVRRGALWERQTRRMGVNAATVDPMTVDPFDLFPDMSVAARGAGARPPRNSEDRKALATLGLDASADTQDIKVAYKELVRRYHPDLNGGERRMETRLRDVIDAYRYLMGRDGARA